MVYFESTLVNDYTHSHS